ncbi:hypothetical protein E1264_11825 [Actinomadura sp. KC216]|uniref:hypothetical protein n=1 Tax=Actinomadura sp. KC216 TaxID=2530370 RepID=UPI001045F2D1|nr:hypothetical protein [Actinomadura sp. KC216]TDB88363.1 hypothetical protein E1264_11825 [Actinomadura sp. KC216]
MTTPDPTRLELAITELKGSMDAGMARIEGRLDLLVQRAEHSDQRARDQAAEIRRVDDKVDKVDDRVDKVEAAAVTRAELDERSKRTIQIVAIICALLGSATGAGTAILIAVMSNGG